MLPILAIKTIAELAFTAIPLVERLVRGKGRGVEKKTAAREFILEELQNVASKNPEALPDFQNFDWVAAIADWQQIVSAVEQVIDATVNLLNILSKYNRPVGASVVAAPLVTAP